MTPEEIITVLALSLLVNLIGWALQAWSWRKRERDLVEMWGERVERERGRAEDWKERAYEELRRVR